MAYLLRGLSRVLSAVTRVCVEVFRGLPVVLTIFFVARGFPEFGFYFDNFWYLVIGLTIYNSVVIGEILRSGMEGLPGGQAEAAAAIGLSPAQTTRMILLPQAFRIMLPALISQLVVVLKDTSLGFIISYEETLNIGKQLIGVLSNPIQVYVVIAVLFIVVNYSLSKLAQYVQRRLARGRKTAGTPAQNPPAAALISQAEGGRRQLTPVRAWRLIDSTPVISGHPFVWDAPILLFRARNRREPGDKGQYREGSAMTGTALCNAVKHRR